MGIFSRKSRNDEHLPELTSTQADKLRDLAIAELSRVGIAVTAAGDHLVGPENLKLGLFAVGRKAAQLPETEWPQMLADHFAAIAGGSEERTKITLDELRTRVFPKLMSPATFAYADQESPGLYSYARDVAMTPLLLAIDAPETVIYMTSPQVDEGGGAESMWSDAMANLVREGPGEAEDVQLEGGAFLVFETESVYQSSWMAYFDKLAQLKGYSLGEHGALLSVPATNVLCVHVLTEKSSAADVTAMARFTESVQTQHPSALSPLLYWWNGAEVEPISGHDGQQVNIYLPDQLAHIL